MQSFKTPGTEVFRTWLASHYSRAAVGNEPVSPLSLHLYFFLFLPSYASALSFLLAISLLFFAWWVLRFLWHPWLSWLEVQNWGHIPWLPKASDNFYYSLRQVMLKTASLDTISKSFQKTSYSTEPSWKGNQPVRFIPMFYFNQRLRQLGQHPYWTCHKRNKHITTVISHLLFQKS